MPRHNPSPLEDLFTQLVEQVVMPRTISLADRVTDYFNRVIDNVERRTDPTRPRKKPKNAQLPPPRTKQDRSKAKGKPKPPPKSPKPAETAYDVLGVHPKAPQEVLQAAYKALARMYHPDLRQPLQQTIHAHNIRTVNDAWQRVKTPEARRKYDREIGL